MLHIMKANKCTNCFMDFLTLCNVISFGGKRIKKMLSQFQHAESWPLCSVVYFLSANQVPASCTRAVGLAVGDSRSVKLVTCPCVAD
jgi:hypothetical protein